VFLLKLIGPPGSLGFLAASIAAALVIGYAWPRKPRLAQIWLSMVLGLYLVLSWPPMAALIVGALPAAPGVGSAVQPLDTLIVFDGDNRRGRAQAADLAVRAGAPEVVHVLGSYWIIDRLTPAVIDRMRHHPAPANTRQQVEWVERFVTSARPGRVAIVVSRLQAPRVAALAARGAPTVPIIASALDREPATLGIRRLIPSYAALSASRDAIYELAALCYYRWQGWI